MRTGAIIVAGGRGARAGGEQPKQLAPLGGKPVLSWSMSAFANHTDVAALCIVAPESTLSEYVPHCPDPIRLVAGGATRTDSVRAGLAALADADLTHVLVHDAARPGLDRDMISALIAGLGSADAIAPALPVADALKRQEGGKTTTVDRDKLYRVQTPQGFNYHTLCAALEKSNDHFVDDLEAVEALGTQVTLIAGSEHLSKITYPEDFHRMSTLLAPNTPIIRMGTGFDVHKFADGDHVSLCGVKIPHHQGLAGHSDADVAWHALTDAILGALALGDIGDHFPPSDPQWKDADSRIFLAHAAKLATERGYEIANCDLTVICEAPKVKPRRQAMRACTADCLGIDVDRVSVKATTTEGLGFPGRGEGIAAQAAVTLSLKA